MERIPSETWGKVLRYLVNSRDSLSAYKTCESWKEALEPTKTAWMFGLVFPHVEPFLPPSESLKCRTICQHWRHGVNNFLENHPHFRPTLEQPGSPENVYNSDHRWLPEFYPLSYPTVIFDQLLNGCHDRRDDMIRQVPNYSTSLPLVSKWFKMNVSPSEELSQLRKQFLDSFGGHIWFLHVAFEEEHPPGCVDAMKVLLEYLPLFPNLKRLEVEIYRGSTTQQTKQELKDYLETPAAMERIKMLPKCLETLEMSYDYDCPEELKEAVTEMMFHGKTPQSLSLGSMSDVTCVGIGNIVDLSVNPTNYCAVNQLFRITSPVRRLGLPFYGGVVPLEALLQVAKHFRKSLRNLYLRLDYNFLAKKVDEKTFQNRCFSLETLTNPHALEGLNNVKRITVMGACLVSLNFLCGLSRTLEYLHMMIQITVNVRKNIDVDEQLVVEPFLQRMEFTEELDLMERLRQFAWFNDRRVIYESNVWRIFPKLRELTVQISSDIGLLDEEDPRMFRRDVYDKLNNN